MGSPGTNHHQRLVGVAVVVALLLGLVAVAAKRPAQTHRAAPHTKLAVARTSSDLSQCPWLNSAVPLARRVDQLVGAMSPLQEATMLHLLSHGVADPYEGYSAAIPALCIPSITEQDGSAGVASGWTAAFGGATQLPAPIADAAAFDPPLARSYGDVIGNEEAAKGVDMALAPTLNIDRSPLWGRSYESLGEDPYLTATLGVQLIEGIQANRVVAVVKHFAVYNQETHRGTLGDDAIVSDQALHEIYLPAFSAAVQEAHPGGVMCSYNLINGTPACQDLALLAQTLRGEWGFAGFVRSDCGSVYLQAPALAAGVSQVKCSLLYNPRQLADAVAARTLPRAALDALARPLLTVLFQYNLIAAPHPETPSAPVAVAPHAQVALQTANEGAVLLRNEGHLLPLDLSSVHSLALIGADGATPMPSGFGAIYVRPIVKESAEQALRSALGDRLHYNSGANIAAAAATARRSSVAVVVVSDVEIEGRDRSNLNLPGKQNALIAAVERANPRTVVVLETGAAVLMPWLPTTPALLETWYPGEVAGTSLLQILSGQADPSGKLPVTFPTSVAAMPDNHAASFGGVAGRTDYSDGIDVGYRWYEVHGVTPAFPFGFGLSYTDFSFSGLKVGSETSGALSVSVKVTNVGQRAGADVIQCYVEDPSVTGEPPRQLRGFQRVALRPGTATDVTMNLAPGDLATWAKPAQTWKVAAGTYRVWVGDGSDLANLPLHADVVEAARSLGANSGPRPAAAFSATPVAVRSPKAPPGKSGRGV